MPFLNKLFGSKNNGSTFDRAQRLHCASFPSYMTLGRHYRVIETTDLGICVPPGDRNFIHMIQLEDSKGSPVIFIKSPYNLPRVFWVRGLLTHLLQYEILPADEEGVPLQVQQARKEDFAG